MRASPNCSKYKSCLAVYGAETVAVHPFLWTRRHSGALATALSSSKCRFMRHAAGTAHMRSGVCTALCISRPLQYFSPADTTSTRRRPARPARSPRAPPGMVPAGGDHVRDRSSAGIKMHVFAWSAREHKHVTQAHVHTSGCLEMVVSMQSYRVRMWSSGAA